jgi:hypothetical protein
MQEIINLRPPGKAPHSNILLRTSFCHGRCLIRAATPIFFLFESYTLLYFGAMPNANVRGYIDFSQAFAFLAGNA